MLVVPYYVLVCVVALIKSGVGTFTQLLGPGVSQCVCCSMGTKEVWQIAVGWTPQ